ncbi:MAG: phosphoribosyltransferase family protein, partial [Pseudomonadota bacterium]|nr:phosphoribosyltransferase family protein [Pseudomonadota bacterium]
PRGAQICAVRFACVNLKKARLAGRHILLVDDVLITGATVQACIRTVLRAGAEAVDVVALARVVMPKTLAV